MDPGVTAWLDPDNNQAFLAGKVSATVNVNTIYLAARAAAADRSRQEEAHREHGPRQLAVGAGRALRQLQHQPVGGLRVQQEPRGQHGVPARLASTRSSSSPWTKTGQSYFIPPFKGLEKEDVWPDDPKLKIFRELNKVNRLPGTPDRPTPAAAEAVNKFVLVDMFANAATGQDEAGRGGRMGGERIQAGRREGLR